MGEPASKIEDERSVTADVEALREAIEGIDVSYGLRWGQKRQARQAHRHAEILAHALVGRVADLERRCREAEAGIAVTHAIRAALQA